MNLNFKDDNLALIYVQTKLKENYNSDIIVTGDYYTAFNKNYGFAHYVFKYLNTFFPPLGTNSYDVNVADDNFNIPKNPTDVISIANYFASDNKGNKLRFPRWADDDNHTLFPKENDVYWTTHPEQLVYKNIYSRYIGKVVKRYDMPIFTKYSDNRIDYPNKADRIYNLYMWRTNKEICEIDDLVMSYLLGRTITPNSSMEDIYYAQVLLLGENNIAVNDRGLWISDSGDLTNIIATYQASRMNVDTTHPLFVTGYLDIYTEAQLLKDRGEQLYGVHGL